MSFDPRILKVGITINGELRVYEGLAITAKGSKFASATQNETVVRIANLNRDTRNFLSTEGSPYNRIQQRIRQKIFIEAGRKSYGSTRLYVGDIMLVELSQPPDIWTTIRAITSQFKKGNTIQTNEGALSSFKTIAQKAATTLGLDFQFEATDKQIANYGYAGSATKQIDKIAQLADADVYIDDETLVVKDKGVPLSGAIRLISQPTGMIGKPSFTDFGIKVKYFFDIHSKVGQQIKTISKFNPATDGQYHIFKLNFDLSNRDKPFYYEAECLRNKGII